jgi:pimeloyl-ACP methyl ester carboxylesterase
VRNGWIVIAPDHTGNTTFDTISPRPFDLEAVRAYDVRATIDFMENLASDHPLAGHVDTSRVLVGGHSYGGLTAWIVGGPTLDLEAISARCAPDCVEAELDAYRMYSPDPRVVGVVALDGGITTDFVADAGFADMAVPALFMTPAGQGADMELFDRSGGADVTWIQLEGGCHHSFTGELQCRTLPLSTSLPITATYMLAFGMHTVLQSEDPAVLAILDGTTIADPSVTYARHRP